MSSASDEHPAGKPYSIDAKQMAVSVLKVCIEEQKRGARVSTNKPGSRAAQYTGVSRKSLNLWKKEADGMGRKKVHTQGGDRKSIDIHDRATTNRCLKVIREILGEWHSIGKRVTIRELLHEIQNTYKMNVFHNISSLWRFMKRHGFIYKRSKKYTYARETERNIKLRHEFLLAVQANRYNGIDTHHYV
jgi:transposase